MGLSDGRQLRGVQNLVGVGVADAADEARIGEGALECAVLLRQRAAKTGEIRVEKISTPPGSMSCEGLFATHHVERGAALAAGFGERE